MPKIDEDQKPKKPIPCKACLGVGRNLNNYPCRPCGGTGVQGGAKDRIKDGG